MEKCNLLIIGGGGREHALAWKLSQSPLAGKLFVAPGNPGSASVATNVDVDVANHQEVIDFVKNKEIDLVVVGPEQPLVDGLTDSLLDAGILVFGPDAYASQLEGSKAFAKSIMAEKDVPTANYAQFDLTDQDAILDYLANLPEETPIVLKADGLAGGKGVFVCQDKLEARTRLDEMRSGGLKDAASKLVIEEFLEGEEASVFALCDGEHFVTLTAAQDHKRIGENDTGLNTGGMGAYTPAPLVTDNIMDDVKSEIIAPVLETMREHGHPYVGVLYVGLMIKDGNARVVEFNCRFGDPECQVILPKLEEDLLEILLSSVNGELENRELQFTADHYCTVVMASGGYPESYEKGFEIKGLDQFSDDQLVFHSGTKHDEQKVLLTDGGRVLNIVGKGPTLEKAITNAYGSVEKISFENAYFRKDIGQKGLNS